jgi:F-type H+-transporting ATPase subunit epsilon
MFLELVTPDKKLFEGEVISVRLPGVEGTFEVLNHHASIVSVLDKGDLRVRTADKKDTIYKIDGGVVEMLNNKLVVLIERILH